jgi:hypothetical protein
MRCAPAAFVGFPFKGITGARGANVLPGGFHTLRGDPIVSFLATSKEMLEVSEY